MKKYYDKLYAGSKEQFYKIVKKNLKDSQKMFIITANPEMFNYCSKNAEIERILLDKNVSVVADGIGLVKTARFVGKKISERITGIDLTEYLLELSNHNKYRLALLGAKKEVIHKLAQTIKEKYPNIDLTYVQDGYTSAKDEFFDKIKPNKVDICLVALGMPEQEKLIYKHFADFNKGIFVGVGGSFDVLSGYKKRAPKIIQKMSLEWLYRLIKEPKRIKRFYNNNVKFVLKMILLKYKRNKK